MRKPNALSIWRTVCLPMFCFFMLSIPLFGQGQTIEILADHDSRFKIGGQSNPRITLKAGEVVTLKITAVKGKNWNRDGVIHGFTLVRLKGRTKVPGWNLELKEGLQEFTLTAPEPGEYEVLCTVICSDEHEGMRIKVVVVQ